MTVGATPPAGMTAEHRISTDGGATWSAPAAGASFTATAEGETLVQFRFLDGAGNPSAWGPGATPPTGAATIRLDRTNPPDPTLVATADTTVPLSSRTGRVELVTGYSGDAERVIVTEAGRIVVDAPAGTFQDTGLADDTTYGYEAVAVDAAGNRSGTVTAEVTTPDRTPPAQPAAPSGSGYPITLSWTGVTGAAAYDVSRGGAVAGSGAGLTLSDAGAVDTAAPPSPTGVSAAATGPGRAAIDWSAVLDQGTPYAFAVRASDAEGNASAYSAPSTLLARSGISRYRVLVDGTQVAETNLLAVDLEGLTGDVAHTITVVALDRAGNASAPSAPISVTVPSAASTARLRVRVAKAYVKPGDVVSLSATVEGSALGDVSWQFGNGSTAAGTQVQTTYTTAGKRTVAATVQGTDGRASQAVIEVLVDDTPPTVDVTQSGATAQVQATDDASGLERLEWLPAPGVQGQPVPGDGIPLAEGPNTITVRATDRAGNVREVTKTLVADRTAPTLSVRIPALAIGKSAAAQITAADAGSGLAAIEYAGKRFPARTAKLVLPAGRRVTLTAIDAAGNRRDATFTIRRVANAKRGTRLVWAKGEPKLKGNAKVLYATTWAQLQVLGKLPKKAKPNGRYTKKMATAVTKYQKKVKLKGTGIVEPKTRARLAKDVAKKTVVITAR
ncbi:MAG: PKD domain-containing protein [Thermoleophilia bacterium]